MVQSRNKCGINPEQIRTEKADKFTTQTKKSSSKTIKDLIPEQMRNKSGINTEQKETDKFKPQSTDSKKTNSSIPEQFRINPE